MPTKNSSPATPALRRAARAPGAARPRRLARARRALASTEPTSSCSNSPASTMRDAREPVVGDEQVRAAADHEHRQRRGCAARRRPTWRSSSRLGAHEHRERAAAAIRREPGARARRARTRPGSRAASVAATAVELVAPARSSRRLDRRVVDGRPSQASGSAVRSPAPRVSTTSPGRAQPARARRRGRPCRGQVRDRQRRRRVEHRVHDEPPGHARDRRLARGVHVGEHDRVGAVERAGEVAPQRRGARVAVRLEHHDHPAPPALARGRDRGRDLARAGARSRR